MNGVGECDDPRWRSGGYRQADDDRQAARLAASQAQAARVRADRDRRLEKLVVDLAALKRYLIIVSRCECRRRAVGSGRSPMVPGAPTW